MDPHTLYEQRLAQPSDIVDHLPRLHEMAQGTVLELGVRYGTSTAALLAGVVAHGGRLISVDLVDCSQAVPAHPQWLFIQADSLNYGEIYSHLDGSIHLLFIDTDHTYERTKAELELWGNITKGWILLHDTDSHHAVRRAVLEYCQERGLLFWLLPGSHGLGMIRC